MAILRPTSTPATRDGRHFALGDFEGQKREFLDSIRAEAQQILAEARREADAIRTIAHKETLEKARAESGDLKKKAREEGLAEGRRQAETEYRAKLDERLKVDAAPVVSGLQALMEKYSAAVAELQKQSEAKLVKVALALAKKIINVETSTNPEVLSSSLGEALALLPEAARVEIRLNATDLERAKRLFPSLVERDRSMPEVVWVKDEGMAAGSCSVRAGDSSVEKRLDEQWKKLMALVVQK